METSVFYSYAPTPNQNKNIQNKLLYFPPKIQKKVIKIYFERVETKHFKLPSAF